MWSEHNGSQLAIVPQEIVIEYFYDVRWNRENQPQNNKKLDFIAGIGIGLCHQNRIGPGNESHTGSESGATVGFGSKN